jgi:hypothetical protein
MTKSDIIKHWADAWRSLAAWGAPIPMSIDIRRDNGCGVLGLARPAHGTAFVKDTGDLVGNLKTALHELAHLAAPSHTHHGIAWRELFTRGAAEALGVSVYNFDLDVSLEALNDQVADAVREWLERSGQTVVLRAIGVLS